MKGIESRDYDYLTRAWLQDHRFTTNAIKMIQHATDRALDRGIHGELPAVLALWAMLRWERKIGVVVLEQLGVDLRMLEMDVESEWQALPPSHWRDGQDGRKIGNVVLLACEQSRALGHDWVGTEHLVLALCEIGDPLSGRVLQRHGISADRYKAALLPLLGGER
jgi:ATP-dependent Clp protease ATP-binding subunit ClpA